MESAPQVAVHDLRVHPFIGLQDGDFGSWTCATAVARRAISSSRTTRGRREAFLEHVVVVSSAAICEKLEKDLVLGLVVS